MRAVQAATYRRNRAHLPRCRVPRVRSLAAALVLSFATACAAGPDYRPPSPSELKLPAQFANAPRAMAETDVARWWQTFDDPVLDTLIERGLAANLDIEQAGARLRRARAQLAGARGTRWPSVDASASGTRSEALSGDSDAQTRADLGIDAAYEVDLFGGRRRSIEAARADAQGAQASLHDVQLSVAAEIALNYLAAREAQARLRIARDTLAALDETAQIVDWRLQAGLVGTLDLEQARQLRAQTAASIPALEFSQASARNRLAVLLGEAPGAVHAMLVEPGRELPIGPAVLPAAIPAEVIRQRPDVALSERTLAADTARIGVAQAQLYPALRLTGSIAGSGDSLSEAGDNFFASLIAGITAPIFRGGQLRAALEAQRAATSASFAAYRQTVLVALEEVENALVSVDTAERRMTELERALDSATNAATLARMQYRSGLIDFQSLLESERALLSSLDSLASARVDRATAVVQLYKALGGGWQAAPEPATVSTH